MSDNVFSVSLKDDKRQELNSPFFSRYNGELQAYRQSDEFLSLQARDGETRSLHVYLGLEFCEGVIRFILSRIVDGG